MGGGRPASLYRDLSFQARSLVLISPRAYPHRTEPPSETLTPGTGSRVGGENARRPRVALVLVLDASRWRPRALPSRPQFVPGLSG